MSETPSEYPDNELGCPETDDPPAFKYDSEDLGSPIVGQFYAQEGEVDYLHPCTYCGMPADSIDHIPPRSIREQLSSMELRSLVVKEVPACRECNSALGARPIWTMNERRQFVKHWLRRRYAKYLRIPNWTEEKFEEMSPGLVGMIKRNLAIRDLIRQRLQW